MERERSVIRPMAQIVTAAAAGVSGSWMAFHSPEEWAAQAGKMLDSGIAIGYVVLSKLPSIEALAYALFSRLAHLFI